MSQTAFAVSIKDYKYYNYDVFFTNPECKAYKFDKPVYSNDGSLLYAKPKNVYCLYKDAKENQKRQSSPHYNLVKLITDSNLKELKMAYLSFSNSDIIKKLCSEAITKNNVKVTLIVDKKNLKKKDKVAKLDLIKNCKPAKKYTEQGVANYPRIEFRGHSGKIGFAHNKIIIASYKKEKAKRTIVYSSANMSSGTTLHHENWHFLTTSKESYFAQVHECVVEGMDKHSRTIRSRQGVKGKSGLQNFVSFMDKCRSDIKVKEESDIKISIVPGDGKAAMNNIIAHIKDSTRVSIAVHRFTHKPLLNALKRAAKKNSQEVRFIADDDIYWSGMANYVEQTKKVECYNRAANPNIVSAVGANMCNEYFRVQSLKNSGAKIKYMETNQNLFLLHHNKYIVFELKDGSSAVHCGAGNFTAAAFSKNFENFYFITIPEVVEKFKTQYDYVWNELATSESNLPEQQVLPTGKKGTK